MRDSEWRSRTLDGRTDRLARRLWSFPLDRDTYRWAMLRLDVASHDAARVMRLELTPAIRRLGEAADSARRAFEDLAARLR